MAWRTASLRAMLVMTTCMTYALFATLEVAFMLTSVLLFVPRKVPRASPVRALTTGQWACNAAVACGAWLMHLWLLHVLRRDGFRQGWCSCGRVSFRRTIKLGRCARHALTVSLWAAWGSVPLATVGLAASLCAIRHEARTVCLAIESYACLTGSALVAVSSAMLFIHQESHVWAGAWRVAPATRADGPVEIAIPAGVVAPGNGDVYALLDDHVHR